MDMSTVIEAAPRQQNVAGPTVLEADRVEKTYPNGTHALDGTTVKIGRGEFVSLLGPSGCGKSTLLKMFAGLEAPSSGRIVLHAGADAAGDTSGNRSMAMVFQEATLMPWARVAENVRLPLDLAGMPREQSDPRIREALELVGLSQFEQAYPRELSGGMQMRASIARALVVRAEHPADGRTLRRARRVHAQPARQRPAPAVARSAASPWFSSRTASTRPCSCPAAWW